MKKAVLVISICLVFLTSCSINRMAINAISNALTGAGSADVFTGDSDPQLVGDALPFAIKMYEALLSQNPNHQGLLLTTGSLFVMYANAFVQGPAEKLDPIDHFEERIRSFDRAKNLYLRGYNILMSAWDKRFPGFSSARLEDGSLQNYLRRLRRADVPLLFWTVAAGLSAFSIDIFDFELGANIPEWAAMMARAYELYPDFNNGAINEFYIVFYAAMPESLGGNRENARIHFQRAVEKSGGLSAGPFVTFARAVNIPEQDYEGFRRNLEMALEINPDDSPSTRLLNIISQRKARFLLDNVYEFFPSLF